MFLGMHSQWITMSANQFKEIFFIFKQSGIYQNSFIISNRLFPYHEVNVRLQIKTYLQLKTTIFFL